MSLRGFAIMNFWSDDVSAAAAWSADFLGIPPYFERHAPAGRLAYAEFRVGDHQDELGIIDNGYRPPSATGAPGGADMHNSHHVDVVASPKQV
ncbi:hypothetical protein CLV30_102417 [Haloactinopolyspora alba]|uniref:Glyoxalase/bleomycin resistance protein/dioxygenase superfamily protein n=1 Tax=Haloactinopolyspora alba TaxID=648780 RepID=A0A2P8EC25_9ACTN|nr:hypothetical protein [Haloactinopolyspora alba]PSL07028.1 hypothetical protein CLV30_102417 [Haloactinopolyspora alba]